MRIIRRHCEEATPTKQSMRCMDCRVVVSLLLAMTVLLVPSAYAEGECHITSHANLAGPVAIVRGMADYKAAMEAGYAACMVRHPEKFAPLREAGDFMQANMQEEMDRARTVLDRLVRDEVSEECAAPLQSDIAALIDGQYEKSYARRHRIMAQGGLVDSAQDSCLIIREMVQQYERHYDRFARLQHVLYESSKKKGSASGLAERRDYRLFERARKAITEGD